MSLIFLLKKTKTYGVWQSSVFFLVILFLSFPGFAQDVNRSIVITITSNIVGAAVYTGTKSKKQFIGYTPVKNTFYFRTDATRHRIFLSKPGYEVAMHLVGPKNITRQVTLKKSTLFNQKPSSSDQTLRSVQNQVNNIITKLLYTHGVNSKLILPQGISIDRDNKNTVLQLVIEIIDHQSTKQLKAKNRIRNTKQRVKGLSDLVIDEVEDLLQTMIEPLRTIHDLDLIQVTVIYPIASNKVTYRTTRDREYFSSSTSSTNYKTGVTTLTVTTGYRPVTRHKSDMTWGKEISSLRFLFPLSEVGHVSLKKDLLQKGKVFVWDKKKNGDGQFLLVKPDIFQ